MPISETTRIRLIWLALLASVLALGWALGAVLTPFLIALTLAYALAPAVERMARWRIPRPLGATIALLLVGLALLAVGSLMLSVLSETLPQLQQQVPSLLTKIAAWASARGERLGLHLQLDLSSLKDLLMRMASGDPERWVRQILDSARSGGGTLLNLLANAVLVPVLTLYLLLDWRPLLRRSFSLVPPRRRAALRAFVAECDDILGKYLRGQLVVMVVLAGFYTVGLSLAGFQLALPIGVFTGLAVCVPFVGFGLGLLLALLAGALQFQSMVALWPVALVYGVGQALESWYLTPKLLGHHIGLHPLFVMFLLLASAHLFGFIGVVLALPAGALMLAVARHALAWYRNSPLFLR